MKKLYKLFVIAISFVLFSNINVFALPLTADQKIDNIKKLSSIYPNHTELIESIAKTYNDKLSMLEEDVKNFFPKDCTYLAPEIIFLSHEEIVNLVKHKYFEQSLMRHLPPDKVNINDTCHLHILAIFYNKSLNQIRQIISSVKAT